MLNQTCTLQNFRIRGSKSDWLHDNFALHLTIQYLYRPDAGLLLTSWPYARCPGSGKDPSAADTSLLQKGNKEKKSRYVYILLQCDYLNQGTLNKINQSQC